MAILRFRDAPRLALAVLTFAGVTLVFTACSDDGNSVNGGSRYLELVWELTDYNIPTDISTGTDQIMPLGKDYFWRGSYEHYDASGNVIEADVYSILVTRDTLINSETWYILAGTQNLFTNRSDGLWAMYGYAEGRTLQDPVLHSKYPAIEGDTYPSGDTLVATVTVLSTDTLVTVPAGEYHCYLYEWDRPDRNRVDRFFLAPDFGWVKYEFYAIP